MATVFLPMEIFNREYAGKLALAVELANSNINVIIGFNHKVREFALNSEDKCVFFETKGKHSVGMEYLDLLRQKGFGIVGQDEEAGISYENYSDFLRWRPEVKGVDFFDYFFAWGKRDRDEYLKYSATEKIVLSGSPRTLFWGDFGRKFYFQEIKKAQEYFGKYILIASNTAERNRIISARQNLGLLRMQNHDQTYRDTLRSRAKWEGFAFEITIKAIENILQNSDLNLVIRPHPVEDPEIWKALYGNNPRVFVSKEGLATPVILGASRVVHAGSTVGLESIACGVPTISLQGLIPYQDSEMTPNILSTQPKNWQEFQDLVTQGAVPKMNQSMLNLIEKCGSREILEIQSSAIVDLFGQLSFAKTLKKENLKKTSNFRSRMVNRIIYGKSPMENLHRNKRPRIELVDVNKDVERLGKMFKFNRAFNIEEIAESTFKIEPAL